MSEREGGGKRERKREKVGAVAAARHPHCITLRMLDLSPESALKMKDEQGKRVKRTQHPK